MLEQLNFCQIKFCYEHTGNEVRFHDAPSNHHTKVEIFLIYC